MFSTIILAQINGNLFGFLPEPLGMLIFGVGLIAAATALRRFFNRQREATSDGFRAGAAGGQTRIGNENSVS